MLTVFAVCAESVSGYWMSAWNESATKNNTSQFYFKEACKRRGFITNSLIDTLTDS